MRILFGILGLGNGHYPQSRELVAALRARGHDVHVLVSARPLPDHWRDSELADADERKGIPWLGPGRTFDFPALWRDIRGFDASGFDLTICDFDPITARIARRAGLPCIGIGNPYAYRFPVPMAGGYPFGRLLLNRYAPVSHPFGLHWHHFDEAIFPPIIPRDTGRPGPMVEGKVLVYLPYEDPVAAVRALRRMRGFDFRYYAAVPAPIRIANVRVCPISREGMLADLRECAGVFCNTGFTLASEALHLGKRLLVIPAGHRGQRFRRMFDALKFQHASNSLALEQLGLATVARRLGEEALRAWLAVPPPPPLGGPRYPDVAGAIADLVTDRGWNTPGAAIRKAWDAVRRPRQGIE